MIPDSLLGRIELVVLAVSGWLVVLLITFSTPVFKLMWIGKIFYVIILLMVVLGIPILQMEMTSPHEDQSEMNYVFWIIVMEELLAILTILLITYIQRRPR